MRPGRGWKSFSSAIAGPGNVRKTEDGQCVDGAAHLARRGRTLRDRRKTQAKTTDRQSRTLRPFIWPSVGRCLRASPVRPSSFPEDRCAAPACEIASESLEEAYRGPEHRRTAKEGACGPKQERGVIAGGSTVMASVPLLQLRRTDPWIAARWQRDRAPRGRPACRSAAAWSTCDQRVQRLPTV